MVDAIVDKNIKRLMKLVKEADWDWLMVADGDERIGKTTLLLQVMLAAEPPLDRAIQNGEYYKPLERVAWTFDSMMELVKNLPDGTVQLYDEASMLGREAMREHNLRMVRVMSTIGIRNRMYLWTFPDFYMLDPYLRDGRVRTRAFVHTVDSERGYVTWYVRQRFPFPRPGGETVWWRKAFSSRFSNVQSLSKQHAEFWERFREKESAAKSQILEGRQPDARREIMLRLRQNTDMTLDEIGVIVGYSKGMVATYLKGTPSLSGPSERKERRRVPVPEKGWRRRAASEK